MRNKSNRANNLFQLDGGTSHHGVDNDDNGKDTNRLPKPPYPDGLKETDNLPEKTNPDSREPEGTNVTDASVGESYLDALWRLPAEAFNDPISVIWGGKVSHL